MILGVSPRDKWKEAELSASSDTGDVSRIMPTCLFTTACWPIGCSPHTWQATASGGTSIGDKGALYASKVAAGIVYDLFTKPQVLAKITKEFRNEIKNHTHRCMKNDRYAKKHPVPMSSRNRIFLIYMDV